MATAVIDAVPDKKQLPPTSSDLGLSRPDRLAGLWDWMTTVDHKKIGILYGLAALTFFLIGGLEALIIRIQLAVPENDFVSAQTYNQLFTMHGTTMVFLAIMPMSAAFFNYIMPLQIGARDVAFPRLNAFSLWAFMAGAIIINLSWVFQWAQAFNLFGFNDYLTTITAHSDVVPSVGWFGYAPITENDYSGIGTDFWIIGLQILGVASIAASLNFIVTIINMRAPGITMMRLPVFSWMTLVTSFLIILAFPAITIALAELMFDRFFGTNFYNVLMGGQPILWQHLFWIFGHPEVYILILPAMGIISEVIPTFARKPLFGYAIVVFSGAVIGFLGFAVWSHHMFTTGLGKVANAAFALLTMAIAVPTGVKIFNWIGTLWGGRIRFTVPMVFACGFIWMFMMGGFSGIMHSAAPADSQQQDSYFVVAHFHYVLIGGSVLALLAGIYYWFPKMSGRMLSEKIGYWVAALVIIGFNITFFPMHYLGLIGMPRRTHTYLEGFGWETWNMVATIGALILGTGIALFVINMLVSMFKGEKSGDDPWNARTLEWAISNPPPAYNFARTPVVTCRDPWWVHKHGDDNQKIDYEREDPHGIHMPSQSWWPLMAGLGLFTGGLSMALHQGMTAIAGALVLVIAIYFWALEGPGGYHLKPEEKSTGEGQSLPLSTSS